MKSWTQLNLMKTINFVLLLVFLCSLSGCQKEELEGTLKVEISPTPDYVWIYSAQNDEYPICDLHSPTMSLNIGNYIIECRYASSHLVTRTGFQIRQDKTTLVTYNGRGWTVSY